MESNQFSLLIAYCQHQFPKASSSAGLPHLVPEGHTVGPWMSSSSFTPLKPTNL